MVSADCSSSSTSSHRPPLVLVMNGVPPPPHAPMHAHSHEHAAWYPYRSPRAPLTPPASAIDYPARPNYFTHRSTTVLPPISAIDQRLRAPPTPPYETASYSIRLPPLRSHVSQDTGLSSNYADYVNPLPHVPPPPAVHDIDWLGVPQAPCGRNLAEKMCETICYIWYAPPTTGLASPPHDAAASREQLLPAHQFVAFMQKVLETTQVSQSVIVLALHYIYRLKHSRSIAHLQVNPGSEWRVAISGLMLANKFVDDNTYTNKTWSEVSGVPLAYLNAAEKECLQGLEYDLYVNKEEYDSWLKLLQGLVLSKDRARGLYHQRSRRPPRTAIASRPPPSQRGDSSRFGYGHRARSSSPSRLRLPALHVPTPMSIDPSPAWRPATAIEPVGATSGLKRSAVDAFSPTSGSFDVPRLQKRPTGITLEIPYTRIGQPSPPESKGVSPLEPLSGFGRLSLANSDSPMQGRTTASSQTLVAPYRLDPAHHAIAPQHLYYYALSGSPSEPQSDGAGHEPWRKGRLRCHQPPTTATAATLAPPAQYPVYRPQVVQSAHTSPRDDRLPAGTHAQPPMYAHHPAPTPVYTSVPVYAPHEARSGVPAAPFANAGPPGFHFYASGTGHAAPSAYHTSPDWACQPRGRQW